MDLYCSRCLDVVDNVADAFTEASGAPKKSTKIREILKILGETATRDQQEKTVIFSQWTSMMDLIEPFLFEAGIGFIRSKCSAYLYCIASLVFMPLHCCSRRQNVSCGTDRQREEVCN